MRTRRGFLIPFGVIALAGCEAAVASSCMTEDGQLEAVLASNPRRWSNPPEIRELWRAGGMRETEILVFPAGVSVGPTGHAAIADFGGGGVPVIGPDGSWLGSWTRAGPGPEEIQTPIAAAGDTDGTLGRVGRGRIEGGPAEGFDGAR